MRYLKHYNGDAYSFISSVISTLKKHKGDENAGPGKTYKERCNTLIANHKEYIERYETNFVNNSLESLEGTHPDMDDADCKDLQNLYQYSRIPIKALRHDVLTENGYENNYCPLCGVNLVNTMDHFIPQKGYPLFSVHPLNLIPSCDTCNKGKSNNITDSGRRKFWNVYIDKPPKENYLKCDVKVGIDGIVEVDFRIERGTIDANTYRLIENTMLPKGQNLLGVYKQASGRIISNFINKAVKHIRDMRQMKSLQECLLDLEREVDYEFEENGVEYIIRKALVNSSVFKSNLIEELNRQGVSYLKNDYE